jgi:outer membrane protein assembly factor BamB
MACSIHTNPLAAGQCIACGKEICPDCIKEFGYYCSASCKIDVQKTTSPLLDNREKQKLQSLDRKTAHLAIWVVWILPIVIVFISALYIAVKITDRSGKFRWEIPLEESPILIKSHRRLAYVLFESNRLKAFKAENGKLLWEFTTNENSKFYPVLEIHKNKGILFDEKNIYKITLSSGKIIQILPQKGRIFQKPISLGPNIFLLVQTTNFSPDDFFATPKRQTFQLLKLKRKTLSTDWSVSLKFFQPEIYSSTSRIYIMDRPERNKTYLQSFDTQTGKRLWRRKFSTSSYFNPQIKPSDKALLLGSGHKIYLISPLGTIGWEKYFKIPPSHFKFTSEGNPAILSGDSLHCYQKNGEKLWKYVVGPNEEGFAVDSKRIYIVGSFQAPRQYRPNDQLVQLLKPIGFPRIEFPEEYRASRLYALSSQKGKLVWEKDHISGEPFLEGKYLFLLKIRSSMNLIDAGKLVGETSRILCIKPNRGKVCWRYLTDGSISPLEISKDGIFFAKQEVFFGPGDLFTGGDEPPKISLTALYD